MLKRYWHFLPWFCTFFRRLLFGIAYLPFIHLENRLCTKGPFYSLAWTRDWNYKSRGRSFWSFECNNWWTFWQHGLYNTLMMRYWSSPHYQSGRITNASIIYALSINLVNQTCLELELKLKHLNGWWFNVWWFITNRENDERFFFLNLDSLMEAAWITWRRGPIF